MKNNATLHDELENNNSQAASKGSNRPGMEIGTGRRSAPGGGGDAV